MRSNLKKLKLPEKNQPSLNTFKGFCLKKKNPKPLLQNIPTSLLFSKRRTPSYQRKIAAIHFGLIPEPLSLIRKKEKIAKVLEKEEKAKEKTNDKVAKVSKKLKKYSDYFVWLEIKKETEFFCRYCTRYCVSHQIQSFPHPQDRLFIHEGSTKLKLDSLKKHEKRALHQKATWIYGTAQEKKDLESFLTKEGGNVRQLVEDERDKFTKNEIFPLLSTSYFVAKSDLSLLEGEKLLKFLLFMKAPIMSHYRRPEAIKEAIGAISFSIQKNILNELKSCNAINLQVDELTDITLNKVLTIDIVLKAKLFQNFLRSLRYHNQTVKDFILN